MNAAHLRAYIIASHLILAMGCSSAIADDVTHLEPDKQQVNANAVQANFPNFIGMTSDRISKLLGKGNLSFPGPEPAILYDINNQQAIELLFTGECVTSVKVLKSRDAQRFSTPCLSSGPHFQEHQPALQSHEISWEVFRKCWKELIGMKGDEVAERLGRPYIDPSNQLCWQYCIDNQVLSLQVHNGLVQSFQLNLFAVKSRFAVEPVVVDTSSHFKH